MTEKQGNRLRVLVADKLKERLRIDFLDKAERHRFDLLLQVADQLRRVAAECFLNQFLGTFESAGAGVQGAGFAGQEFGDNHFLVVAPDRFGLGNLHADRFDVARG